MNVSSVSTASAHEPTAPIKTKINDGDADDKAVPAAPEPAISADGKLNALA